MGGVRADLADFRLVNERFPLKNSLIVSCLDIVILLVVLDRYRSVRVPFESGLFRVRNIDFLKVFNLSENRSQVLDGDFARLVSDEEHKFAVLDILAFFSMVVRINSGDRWLFLYIFQVAPGEDELRLTDLGLGQPDIKNTRLVRRQQ